jgi:F-type H+-transporting ATPase subunit b
VRRAAQHSRPAVGFFRIALLLILALAVNFEPTVIRGQQTPPSGQAAAGSPNSSSEAAAEEKGENAYRHSALVKSIAKELHLPVETTARSLEIVNFAIVVFGIGIPLSRFLPKYLRNRNETLRGNLESARQQTEEARRRLSDVEARLAHLDDEIARFRAEIEEQTRGDEGRIKAALEQESARIVAAAEQEIGVAAAQARRGLRNFAAEIAIEQAAQQMKITPESDSVLIAEFVSDLARGGMN